VVAAQRFADRLPHVIDRLGQILRQGMALLLQERWDSVMPPQGWRVASR